ncbi:MAG TPA: hypothetical protein VH107_04870 [Lacipirellulaceae bacterium]|jgi:hypothetical protein|nr:hypothetical protein [Lacipirellulaceae bacterium]
MKYRDVARKLVTLAVQNFLEKAAARIENGTIRIPVTPPLCPIGEVAI